jgi:hypothetical protein
MDPRGRSVNIASGILIVDGALVALRYIPPMPVDLGPSATTASAAKWCVPFARSRRRHRAYRSHARAADIVRTVRTVTPRSEH